MCWSFRIFHQEPLCFWMDDNIKLSRKNVAFNVRWCCIIGSSNKNECTDRPENSNSFRNLTYNGPLVTSFKPFLVVIGLFRSTAGLMNSPSEKCSKELSNQQGSPISQWECEGRTNAKATGESVRCIWISVRHAGYFILLRCRLKCCVSSNELVISERNKSRALWVI